MADDAWRCVVGLPPVQGKCTSEAGGNKGFAGGEGHARNKFTVTDCARLTPKPVAPFQGSFESGSVLRGFRSPPSGGLLHPRQGTAALPGRNATLRGRVMCGAMCGVGRSWAARCPPACLCRHSFWFKARRVVSALPWVERAPAGGGGGEWNPRSTCVPARALKGRHDGGGRVDVRDSGIAGHDRARTLDRATRKTHRLTHLTEITPTYSLDPLHQVLRRLLELAVDAR